MSINRHNYEEYFILYMDNELSSDERRMVELFVQENPDLKEELELLEQFKLQPDQSIQFVHKQDLLKENGEALITGNNYEEWLVLYTDNELNPTQRLKVETYIAANPYVAGELALFQKTKLLPEPLVFAQKQSLYRSEEKVRLISFKWWRAVAAILIVALGLTTVLMVNNKKGDAGTTAGINPVKTDNETPAVTKETQSAQKRNDKAENDTELKNEVAIPNREKITTAPYQQAVANNNTTTVPKENKKKDTQKQILPVVNNNDVPVVVDISNKQDNNLPKPVQNPFVNNQKEDKAIAQNDMPPVKTNDNISATKEVVTSETTQPSDYVLASNDGKKNKNRGIFRKIARTFEKRTNIDPTEDGDRLLVAGFTIKMK